MRRLSLLLLISAAPISVLADDNSSGSTLLLNGGGFNFASGGIAPGGTTPTPTPPNLILNGTGSIQWNSSTNNLPGGLLVGTLTLNGTNSYSGTTTINAGTLTLNGVQFGTNILLGDGQLYPVPPSLSLEGDPSVPLLHPQFLTVTGGTIEYDSPLSDAFDLPEAVEFEPYRLDPEGVIIVDPIFVVTEPPEPTFIETDRSSDGTVALGFDQVSGNWQVRHTLTDRTEPLPMISYSDLLGEDQVGPAVMLTLLANGLSGDGSTVIGLHPNGSAFRYRSDERQSLELLDNGADGALWTSAFVVEQSFNGDIVVGQILAPESQRWQAARWDQDGKLTVLNPIGSPHNHVAKLVTPDGSVVAGDVVNAEEGRSGVVPFVWSEPKGFRQLGDPTASDEQIIVTRLSDDGLTLSGVRGDGISPSTDWFWTEDGGFQDIILVICDFGGNPVEDYSLTGVDLERGIFMGTFEDGAQFLSYDGVTISPTAWMGSLAGPAATLRSSLELSGQTMEGAHHRPIKSLAFPGHQEFAWVTGDLGKATRQRDAEQTAGEFGYGMRIGADAVLGLAFGYSELEQDSGPSSHGETSGAFAVADLGWSAGPGEITLTALLGRTDIVTVRNGSRGETEGDAYSLRVRYDNPLGTLAGRPIGAFAAVTYDHATVNGYTETGGVAPATYNDRSKDTWNARLGVTGKTALGKDTDLHMTLEAVRLLSADNADFSGTDVSTGVLDFTVPDTRGKRTWGRLGFDLDHRLSPKTVLSLTLHASSEGDAFDTAAALSIRRGF